MCHTRNQHQYGTQLPRPLDGDSHLSRTAVRIPLLGILNPTVYPRGPATRLAAVDELPKQIGLERTVVRTLEWPVLFFTHY